MAYSRASQDCPLLSRRVDQCPEDCTSSPWMLDGEQFTECPVKTVSEQSFQYLRAYFYYEKGYFPNPGGWMEQPEKLLQALQIIESERARIVRAEEEADDK